MSNDKRIYFAVKGFVIHEGRFLIMHKRGVQNEWWELPGGRMEFGETAEETLIRELNEETGLFVKPIRLLDTWNFVKADFQITGVIYLCKVEKGEVQLSLEHDKFMWVNAEIESIDYMDKCFKDRMLNWDWDDLVKHKAFC